MQPELQKHNAVHVVGLHLVSDSQGGASWPKAHRLNLKYESTLFDRRATALGTMEFLCGHQLIDRHHFAVFFNSNVSKIQQNPTHTFLSAAFSRLLGCFCLDLAQLTESQY